MFISTHGEPLQQGRVAQHRTRQPQRRRPIQLVAAARGRWHRRWQGGAEQVDMIKIRDESASGFSAGKYNMMNCSHYVISISTSLKL
jgi:hypothetical protein